MTGTRRSTINKRRKGALAFVIPWLRRFGIGLLIAVAGFWIASWLWMSGNFQKGTGWAEEKILGATAGMGFAVENILVEGRVNTDPEVLRAVINIEKGDPLFSFNPDEAREMIRAINWVRDAQVERRLPGTVYVRLEEREPLALWQKDGALSLLDSEGKVVNTADLKKFKDLIIIMGDDAPPYAPDLVKMLAAEAGLQGKIRAAKWIGGRRWDLVAQSGIEIKLPENEIGFAMRWLARAEEEDGILSKDLTGIDLREQGRMTLETKPGAIQEYNAGPKTGSNI